MSLTLTPATARQRLTDDGLLALGLAAPLFSGSWAQQVTAFDPAQLTLDCTGLRAPWGGVLEFFSATQSAEFRDVMGEELAVPCTVMRLHPQARRRLAALAAARLGSTAHTMPATMVVRNLPGSGPLMAFEVGELLAADASIGGAVSFHDNRGLPVCPVAFAVLLLDLFGAFPALRVNPPDGGEQLEQMQNRAAGLVVHLVDPHGRAFAPLPNQPGLVVSQPGGGNAAPAPGPLQDLPPGLVLRPDPNDGGRTRLGWMEDGLATAAELAPPPLAGGGALGRRFLRAVVVDLPFFLLGNRSGNAVRGLLPDDRSIPDSLLPAIRDEVDITYLPNGPLVLAHGADVAARVANAGNSMTFLVSPRIERNVGLPADPAPVIWPAYPPIPPGQVADGFGTLPTPDRGAVANVAAGPGPDLQDVVVTLPAGTLPAGSHVRVFPRVFRVIQAIGAGPSFLRGDGGAARVPTRTAAAPAASSPAVPVLLRNPLGLQAGEALPQTITVDIVVAERGGGRRIHADVTLPIGPAVPPPPDTFDDAPLELADAFVDWFRGTSGAPAFGIPTRGVPAGAGSIFDLVTGLGVASPPRESPRLPTMARFETVLATGILAPGAVADDPLAWQAVLSGGHWARETRATRHRLGNPGNPAGPDLHVGGLRVDGLLAYDLARHALRRCQPLYSVPIPAFGNQPGWMLLLATPTMRPPAPRAPPPANATCSGALLQTVAAFCDSPELALPAFNIPAGPVTLDNVATAIATALGLPPPAIGPSPDADRVVEDIRREILVARNGLRDAAWSLRRAVREATELIYVEGPAFQPTAYDGVPPEKVSLIDELRDALGRRRALRLIVATPREPDFDPAFPGFARQALAARRDVVQGLTAQFPGRVAVFHPTGFPGRAAPIRTSCVIVDDVWALVGTSHWRRRGMTMDGAADVASLDRQFAGGYSARIAAFRRVLMLEKLGADAAQPDGMPTPDFLRLSSPAGAFGLVSDMLAQGGLGRIESFWPGPDDLGVAEETPELADPDGARSMAELLAFAGAIAALNLPR